MGICQINYSEALKGVKSVAIRHPMESWFSAQGARYLGSNDFNDPALKLSEDHFGNVLKIIKSARLQGHDGVEIRLTADLYLAIRERIGEISSIEDVEVNCRFQGDYRNREQIVAMFRTRKADPAPEVAQLEPLSDEDLERLFDEAAREVEVEQDSGSPRPPDPSMSEELRSSVDALNQIFRKNK